MRNNGVAFVHVAIFGSALFGGRAAAFLLLYLASGQKISVFQSAGFG